MKYMKQAKLLFLLIATLRLVSRSDVKGQESDI